MRIAHLDPRPLFVGVLLALLPGSPACDRALPAPAPLTGASLALPDHVGTLPAPGDPCLAEALRAPRLHPDLEGLELRQPHWAAFDVAADRRLWAVFHRDDDDPGEEPSWLVLDLDGDGVLGEHGERLRARTLGPGQAERHWYVGDLPSDDPRRPHTELSVVHYGWTFRWRLRWYGGVWLSGRGASVQEDMHLASVPERAPRFDLHMDGEGAGWVPCSPDPLVPGRTQHMKVALGSAGEGRLATSSFDIERIPSGWTPTAHVGYTARDGTARRVRVDLAWASCGLVRQGMLDVPADLDPDQPVRVRVELPVDCPTPVRVQELTWPAAESGQSDLPQG